jgi:diguanylate cyclase (GGDEF)-like protein
MPRADLEHHLATRSHPSDTDSDTDAVQTRELAHIPTVAAASTRSQNAADRAECERLEALQSYEVLDTESEESFDEIAELAARLTHSPMAMVCFIDAERQWFKARFGMEPIQTPRDYAFCALAIRTPDRPFVVPDATADDRFRENPMVVGPPAIRAYLGVPLVTPEGYALGTLCVLDRIPRPSYEAEAAALKTLARAVTTNLELRRSHLKFRRIAHTDALTGLPDRRAVMSALSDFLARDIPVGLILIDLDYFKEVNDSHGHAAGDLLLQETAARLQRATRQGDISGRLGGDVFVVLLAGANDRAVAAEIAGRISAAVTGPMAHDGGVLRVSATLGVAVAPADANEANMILRAADEALINAKRNGRGSIGLADRQDVIRVRRSAAIFRAFDLDCGADGIVPGAVAYLQPIVRLSAGPADTAEPIGFEVLTRWSAPGIGQVPPDELFAVIGPERASLVSHYVRGLALQAFARVSRMGRTRARLALNLSMGEVLQPAIATRIEDQVLEAGLTLSAVEIEITEEILLDRVSDTTLQQLLSLQDRGAHMILDDFGIANSGLSQLMRMKLDGVKLDKQFVLGLGKDERAAAIVQGAISVAHSLGLHIVAEGVETEDHRARLLSLGCDAAQGYLFSRPFPCADLALFLGRVRTEDVVAQ